MNGTATARRPNPRTHPSPGRSFGTGIDPRLAEIAAYVTFFVVLAIDALTPPTLAIEIAYEVSVVFASLTGKRNLVVRFVALGFMGNLFGLISDASQSDPPWDAVALENRLLSLVSIFIVATLTLVVRDEAERAGRRVAERRAGDRAQALAAAANRIVGALAAGTLARSIAHEAIAALGATEAVWLPSDPSWTAWRARGDTDAPEPPPTLIELDRTNAIRRLSTHESAAVFGDVAPSGILVPIVHESDCYGALVVASDDDDPGAASPGELAQYARFCASALRQAVLLERLDHNERSLVERHAIIESLVEAISHDVRTPLVALSMTLAQAARGAYGTLEPAYASIIAESRISIDDIARLAETLLLVARFEADRSIAFEPVDLRQISVDLVAEFRELAAARELSLLAEIPSGCVARTARPDVRRALTNLIANAIAHTPPGGTIAIAGTPGDDAIELTVTDDGYGVPAHARDALFRRYGHASGGAGNGLGLYIVRRVAESAGGRVRYEPAAPTGSRFVMTLPRAVPRTS